MTVTAFTIEQALQAQAESCRTVGSPLYATLLEGLLDDHRRGGITAELLDGVSEQPVHDAVPLRYVATGHLLALTGRAPALAAHYPSCGGRWAGDGAVVDDFLATADHHRDDFAKGLRRNVQTNEVGRAPVLVSGLAEISARHGLPLDQLEIGSSAGLLSCWDQFAYDDGSTSAGDRTSPLRFGPEWWTTPTPGLDRLQPVYRRRASDISPIDIRTEHGRQTMMSFIWPDQMVRSERLHAAMAIAGRVDVSVEQADAGRWLAVQLGAGLTHGVATIVFHSIVWQYLPASTRDEVRSVLAAAGSTGGRDNPLCWLRMEPATPAYAELRLTTWPDGDETLLAEVGYHGADIRWLG